MQDAGTLVPWLPEPATFEQTRPPPAPASSAGNVDERPEHLAMPVAQRHSDAPAIEFELLIEQGLPVRTHARNFAAQMVIAGATSDWERRRLIYL